MKSRERMGEMPEVHAVTEYDKEQWDKTKQVGTAWAIKKGKEMGVPQETLSEYFGESISKAIANQDFFLVYRLKKNLGLKMEVCTEAEVQTAGEEAYKFYMENKDSPTAMSVAAEIYGTDSDEWKRAKALVKQVDTNNEENETEKNVIINIPKNATLADLFATIDEMSTEDFENAHFYDEFVDHFDGEIINEFDDFRFINPVGAAATKVLDFFKERGYDEDDVSAYLPINFT